MTRFHDVRIESSLNKELYIAMCGDFSLRIFEDPDEQATDGLTLCLRVADSRQLVKEALTCIDDDESDPGGSDIVTFHLFAFTFAQ